MFNYFILVEMFSSLILFFKSWQPLWFDPFFFSTLLIPRFLYRFLFFCLFLKYVMFSSFFSLQLVSGHDILSHDFSDLHAGNSQTFILGQYSLQRFKLPKTWLVMERFCLVHLESESERHSVMSNSFLLGASWETWNSACPKGTDFFISLFSLYLINYLVLFFTLFFEGIPWWSSD